MGRGRRLGATLLAVVTTGALLAACRSPIVEAACNNQLVSSDAGTLQDPALVEVSGIAASTRNPSTLWAHNDSGDTARLFAISESGAARITYTLSGATANDWEDIALGRGPVAGTSYLYVGDIGDNSGTRPNVAVYRVTEPAVTGNAAQTLTGVAKLTLQYPDGPKDSEALLVDPRSGEIYLVQKSGTGGPVGIYRAPANLAAGSTTVLSRAGTLNLPAGIANAVTSADISPDGNAIVVRTYGGVRLWNRATDQTLVAAIGAAPCQGPVPVESQGEAVGFRSDGRAYYTVSEGGAAVVHRFAIP